MLLEPIKWRFVPKQHLKWCKICCLRAFLKDRARGAGVVRLILSGAGRVRSEAGAATDSKVRAGDKRQRKGKGAQRAYEVGLRRCAERLGVT